jgi:large subunit ribosomal protein L31
MKPEIHPNYKKLKVVCSCGNTFETRSAIDKDTLNIEVCSGCHPFYTGKQKVMDTAGRVEKFQKKYSTAKKKPEKSEEKTQ